MTRILMLTLGLMVGNFIYQAATDRAWMVAWERSFFQFWALATYYVFFVWGTE